jgi:FtsP/CotA-like multicopper oxidase with cupredoxin domain
MNESAYYSGEFADADLDALSDAGEFYLDESGFFLMPTRKEMQELAQMGKTLQRREGDLVLVNGGVNPTFRIPKDGLLRLRFLNASVARYYRLQLEDRPMYLIATENT